MFRRFYILVIIRVTLLTLSLSLLGFILGNEGLIVNHLIIGLIVVAQVVELIRFVNRSNRDLMRLFNSLEHADFAVTLQQGFRDKSFRDLEESLNRIVGVYKRVKIEKEAQYHLLNTIVNNVNAGILAVNSEGEIPLINPGCEKILGLKGVRTWNAVSNTCPDFYRAVELLGAYGRKLIELKSDEYNRILSIDVTSTTLLDRKHRIIIIQDINNEIEQKEFEAWNKLIRILTHEIMNSVTPVSSLTETTRMLLEDSLGNPKKAADLKDETISDICFSLKTIQKRSDGMLDFADAYRTFSRVPSPILAAVNVSELLDSVARLMQEELVKKNIQIDVIVHPDVTSIQVDRTLIEQVLINLLTNSIHALHDSDLPKIKIKAWKEPAKVIIEVYDNGHGIPDKEVQHIFVPFYSTRDGGSGIGLSLSKQIMSLHGGTIRVTSRPGEGTSFFLNFRS
jgi:two-component system, NtrC family, nitrogen regulation sensor histidine kinase NtrY